MTIARFLFILFSATAVIMSLMAAGMRRSDRAIFCLSAFLASVSVLFVLMGLYIPAVLHLFMSAGSLLFSFRVRKGIYRSCDIQSTNTDWKKILPAAMISISGAAITVITLINFRFAQSAKTDSDFSLQAFSNSIFNAGKDGFLLPFILLAIIATAAGLAYKAVKEDGLEDKTIITVEKKHQDE